MKYDRLQIVLTSSFYHVVTIAKSKLEDNGIHCYLENDNINYITRSPFSQQYVLKTDEEYFNKAREILDDENLMAAK